jgi:sortase (surface protein transpeptidase)
MKYTMNTIIQILCLYMLNKNWEKSIITAVQKEKYKKDKRASLKKEKGESTRKVKRESKAKPKPKREPKPKPKGGRRLKRE